MKRILFLYLPHLPTERLTGTQPHSDLALVATVKNARRLTALSPQARALGLRIGMNVTDARAIHPALEVQDHDMAGDGQFLIRLGQWAISLSPLVMLQPPDGLAINITGCAHLFGGEAKLAAHARDSLMRRGLSAQIAIADTIGAAQAFAYHTSTAQPYIAPPHHDAALKALHQLPLSALRLPPTMLEGLQALGLTRIGDLRRSSRTAFTRRFGADLMATYDRAKGTAPEPFTPLSPPPRFREARQCLTPLTRFADLCDGATALVPALVKQVELSGHGISLLRLTAFRVDGDVTRIPLRLGAPNRDAAHIARLLTDRLKQMEDQIDAGFGFELLALEALETTRFETRQNNHHSLDNSPQRTLRSPDISRFADQIAARFGDGAVEQCHPRASHWPERSSKLASYDPTAARWHDMPEGPERPLTLFDPPQLIEAIAELPDGPPYQFRWRKQQFQITHAEGPERIAPEWWFLPAAQRRYGAEAINRFRSRDYFRLVDQDGRRFWVFRRGLYGDDIAPIQTFSPPQWFLHGLFG